MRLDSRPDVLVLVENYPVPSDRRVWMEAQALVRAGYGVTVICPAGRDRDTAPYESIGGIAIHRFSVREAGGGPWGYLREYGSALWQIRRLVRRLSREQTFGLVQLCNPPDILTWAIGRLRRRGARVLFDQHDLVPELFEARFGEGRGLLYRASCVAERWTYRRADVVISPNESYRRIAMGRGGKRGEDVFVVRMAPDPARFRPLPPDPALGRGKPFLIAYAGTIGPQDGVDHALRALHLLAGRRDDWHAVFAGAGDAVPDVIALRDELGLGDRVEFAGFLEDEALITLLSSADVCVSPEPSNGLNDASTMIKVVEYMGLGRPIVAYDLRETRFSAGEAALYATPNEPASLAECIETVLDDPALRERMGAAGTKRDAELSWTRSEGALLAAYERALAR